jgi:Lrp/AsnC family transcriptional regulator, leucine-responsive regulatory protein
VSTAEIEIDDIDRQILALLALDARMPVKTIANRVQRSRSAVYDRIQRLEKSRVIGGYTILWGGATPSALRAYIALKLKGQICSVISSQLALIPEIKRCQSLSGYIDMLLYVELSSMAELERVRHEIERIKGIESLTTFPVLADRFDRDFTLKVLPALE